MLGITYIGSISWEHFEIRNSEEIVPIYIFQMYTYFPRINLFPLTRTRSHVNQRSFKTKLFTGFWTAVNWFLTASDRGETCLTDKVPYWISRFELSILEFSPRSSRKVKLKGHVRSFKVRDSSFFVTIMQQTAK